MSRIVHFARHGETVWHAENRYAGTSDVALTRAGREQAGALALWADAADLAVIASSPLQRARDTAAEVASVVGLPLTVDERLAEVHFGRGEGLTRAEMADRFPDALAAFVAAPASSPLPDGEPGAVATGRFVAAVHDLSTTSEGPALVVAHTTVLRLALCRLLGLPLDSYRSRFPALANATVTTVRLPSVDDPGALAGAAGLLQFNAPVL